MRILILNWRCPRNPRAGGAEVLTYEFAQSMLAHGHSVEWFSASFQGAAPVEQLDGIKLVRLGRQWSVHLLAFWHYRKSIRQRFDVVIDEVNTMPFFTPLWAGIPIYMLIFQLAREVWWYESWFPMSAIGFAAEPLYLRPYRHIPVMTISESTRNDLLQMAFVGPITVLPIGARKGAAAASSKESDPTFLYVGRLAPSKRIDHILKAFAQFRTETGTGTLWLVGTGSARCSRSLARLANRLKVTDHVAVCGRVSDIERNRLMARAHALVMASVREGWGLSITEANACGTPAIVYDVPGLRDSVRAEETGLVVSEQPDEMCKAMVRLIHDDCLYGRLAAEALRWSTSVSLEETAGTASRVVEGSLVA